MTSPLSRLSSPRAVVAGLCCLLLALVAMPGQAQTPAPASNAGPPADMQQLRMDKMVLQLDLTDAQRAQVQSVLADQDQRQRALMQKYQKRAQKARSDSAAAQQLRSEMQGEMKAMQSKTESKLAGVLDAGQLERYRTLYGRQPDPNADPVETNLAQLDAQYDLTDGQRAKLRPVIQQQMKQVKSLRQEIQQAGKDQQKRQQVMQKARQMQQQTQQQLQSIMTEEQMQKMQQIRQVQGKIQQAQRRMRQQQMQKMRQMQQRQKNNAQGGGQ